MEDIEKHLEESITKSPVSEFDKGEQNWEWARRNRDSLLRKYEGKWVYIRDCQVVASERARDDVVRSMQPVPTGEYLGLTIKIKRHS